MLSVGQITDRYRVEGLLGCGGVAAVYRVRHLRLSSVHAMKVLQLGRPEAADRMLQEGRAQASLRHANVVAVHDVLEIDALPALLLEYVDGPSLDRLIAHHRLTLAQALDLFHGIVCGVEAAHEAGMIHRDLKPANVLLQPSGTGLIPKVSDFGLVKLTRDRVGLTATGTRMGTAHYMAPEQIRNSAGVDARADLWSLGCILYRLVCHACPFEGDSPMEVFVRAEQGEFVPPLELTPDLPPRVLQALDALLQTDPTKRPDSCRALLLALYPDGPTPAEFPDLVEIGFEHSPQAQVWHSAMHAPGKSGVTLPSGFSLDDPSHSESARPRLLVAIAFTILGIATGALGLATFLGPPDQAPAPIAAPPPPPTPITAPVPVAEPAPIVPPIAVAAPAPPVVPAPVRRAPEPQRPPAPEPKASVHLLGDATGIRLVDAEGSGFDQLDALPAGTYQVKADFEGAKGVDAGSVTLSAGQTATLLCAATVFRCQLRR